MDNFGNCTVTSVTVTYYSVPRTFLNEFRIQIVVLWVLAPCNVIGVSQGFGGTYHVHLQMACEDKGRMFMQNIDNHLPYMVY
jgi:hypothetical protein